jgi:hypothetical protein
VLGPDGRPWHSWRFLILKNAPRPYSELYRAYRFDEPWDGPHNARLAGRIGDFYRRRGVDLDASYSTSFVAGVGTETACPGAATRSRGDIRDGLGQTIMVVETRDAKIPWMKPEDLAFDRMSFRVNDGTGRCPGSQISGARALLATGHVFELSDTFPPATLRSMLTIDGGEPVEGGLNSTEAKLIDAPPASGSSR